MKSWDRVSQLYHYRQAGPDSFWLGLMARYSVGFITALCSWTLITTPHIPTAPSCDKQECLHVVAIITWGSTPLSWWDSLQGITKGRVMFVPIRASSSFLDCLCLDESHRTSFWSMRPEAMSFERPSDRLKVGDSRS